MRYDEIIGQGTRNIREGVLELINIHVGINPIESEDFDLLKIELEDFDLVMS